MIASQRVAAVLCHAGTFGFCPDDVWTLFHSIAFDFSVWEIFGALLHGGRLVVVPDQVSRAPDEFHRLLRRERVTVLNQTPSAMRALLEARRHALAEGRADWHVRVMVCGGDTLDAELAAELRQLALPVWNFYGPTESTVWTTSTLIDAPDPGRSPSIGRPLPGVESTSSTGAPAGPIGVSGELVVAGPRPSPRATGGPARADRRAVRSRPVRPIPRTPLPHRRPGRATWRRRSIPRSRDHQVKIRGYRIELGEIEASSGTAAVRDAVVCEAGDKPPLSRSSHAGDGLRRA